MSDIRYYLDLLEAAENVLPMDTASRMQRAKEMGFTIKAYHGTGASFNAFDINKGRPNPINGHAPYFSTVKGEASGYAKEKKEASGDGKTLSVLLRIRKPFVVNYFAPDQMADVKQVDHDEWEKVVGQKFEPDRNRRDPNNYDALRDAWCSTRPVSLKTDDDRRIHWNEIYRRLQSLGYDAIVWPHTLPDFQDKPYDKYIVLDMSNIRSIRARFDPAKSSSKNLMD